MRHESSCHSFDREGACDCHPYIEEVVEIHTDDWKGVWIDGELLVQGHHYWCEKQLIDRLMKLLGAKHKVVYTSEWGDEQLSAEGEFPSDLKTALTYTTERQEEHLG